MRKIFIFFLLYLLIIPTIIPLLQPGMFPSFDGDLHIVRIWQMYEALRAGQIPGRWAGSLFHGLGQPLFVVNFQLPYYIGAGLYAVGINLVEALKIQLILAIILSAGSMYIFLKKKFTAVPSLVGTILYIWSPYRFVDTYTRAAIGEIWMFVFLPLLMYVMTYSQKNCQKMFFLGSLIWALAVLAHTSFMIVLFPFLLFYALFVAWERKSVHPLVFFLSFIMFGFFLSAFGWMPAVFEKKYLMFDTLLDKAYQKQFISLYQLMLIPHAGMQTVSMLQVGIINTIASLIIWIVLLKKRVNNSIVYFCTMMFWVSLFFMTPQSKYIWDVVPLLHSVIFPWRLLIFCIFTSSVLCAFLIEKISNTHIKYLITTMCIAFIIGTNLIYLWPGSATQRTDEMYKQYKGTTNSFAEVFMPKGVNTSILTYTHPPIEGFKENAKVSHQKIVSGNIRAQVESKKNIIVQIGQLYFPGWQVLIDGQKVTIDSQTGLLRVSVPKGIHTIEARFEETPLRKFADMISLVTFVVWILLTRGLYPEMIKVWIQRRS
jgi:hypothetical protein